MAFRKSSYSNSFSNCVEVDTEWRKSSRSFHEANCVEVARAPEAVAVRDSKDPGGPVLEWPSAAWRAFVTELKTTGRVRGLFLE